MELMAAVFDNSTYNSYVNLGEGVSNHLRDVDPLTVCAWIYPTGWGEINAGRIVVKENSASWGWVFCLMNSPGLETFEFGRYRNTVNSHIRAVDYSISMNVWQHVAATYSSSSMALYRDGVAMSTSIYTVGSGGNRSDAYDYCIIGQRQDLDRGFRGRMEDVRIYNRYLGAGEIAGIAASHGADGLRNGLLGRWPLKEGYPGGSLPTGSTSIKEVSSYQMSSYWGDYVSSWQEGITLPAGG